MSFSNKVAIAGFHEGLAGQVSVWFNDVFPHLELTCFFLPNQLPPVINEAVRQTRASQRFCFPENGIYRSKPFIAGVNWEDELRRLGISYIVCALPDADDREDLMTSCASQNFKILSLIHPSAVILKGTKIGSGTIIEPLVYIGMDADIGSGCHIHARANVDHNSVIEDFVTLNPSVTVAGNVRIGKKSVINISATITNSIVLGARTMVGAMSFVLHSYPDSGLRLLGVPAKPK